MIKFLKKWYEEVNEINTEMNRLGIYTVSSPWGGYYVHSISTQHDRHKTIPENNRRSKRKRQV